MTSPTHSNEAERIVVAMSGGVDSSLAAALVMMDGRDAIGVTMHLAGSKSRCCSLDDADDARRVAERLGIRFYVANYTESFKSEVMEAFADAYLSGRTPIPCVTCNKRFKFDLLLERARVFGADKVVTGHYARISRCPSTGLYQLRRSRDRAKDQTYFLFQLDQAQLSKILFPLGELTKAEVRSQARALGLVTADKPESQEICFVPEGRYSDVVELIRPEAASHRGEIVDTAGVVLGEHPGIHNFTVGQRHGLGISVGRKLYVTRIEADRQRVVVGDLPDLEASGVVIDGTHWISGKPAGEPILVQVRYRHDPVPAKVVSVAEGRVELAFDEPVRAVSPGQAAVFYDLESNEVVLGGGWIDRAVQ